MITARAIGILEEIVLDPSHGGAKGLSEKLGEGKFAIQNAISELRDAGLVETITQRMANGRTVSTLRPTDAGHQVLVTRFHNMQSQLNSQLNLIADLFILKNSKPNSEQGSREVTMEYYESEDERLEAQRKFREKQHEKKLEAHETRRQTRMSRRSPLNAAGWSSTDSTFEFAEQMHALWHIQPWQVTRSRFRYALDAKRKEFNTDGAIELEMMKLYFSQIKHDTKLSDPEMVWKRFIVNFPALLIEVQRSMVTPAQVEVIKERAQRSLDWMDNV